MSLYFFLALSAWGRDAAFQQNPLTEEFGLFADCKSECNEEGSKECWRCCANLRRIPWKCSESENTRARCCNWETWSVDCSKSCRFGRRRLTGDTTEPTADPTPVPTPSPTASPTQSPTEAPSPGPTVSPSPSPTQSPTEAPSPGPTVSPSPSPTQSPTEAPSPSPTQKPTTATPTKSPVPTVDPTQTPTPAPTNHPSETPTEDPTRFPTSAPTDVLDFFLDSAVGQIYGLSIILGFVVLLALAGFLCWWRRKRKRRNKDDIVKQRNKMTIGVVAEKTDPNSSDEDLPFGFSCRPKPGNQGGTVGMLVGVYDSNTGQKLDPKDAQKMLASRGSTSQIVVEQFESNGKLPNLSPRKKKSSVGTVGKKSSFGSFGTTASGGYTTGGTSQALEQSKQDPSFPTPPHPPARGSTAEEEDHEDEQFNL